MWFLRSIGAVWSWAIPVMPHLSVRIMGLKYLSVIHTLKVSHTFHQVHPRQGYMIALYNPS